MTGGPFSTDTRLLPSVKGKPQSLSIDNSIFRTKPKKERRFESENKHFWKTSDLASRSRTLMKPETFIN